MTVYQCLRCRGTYGSHPDFPQLTPFPSISQRYADCDIWNCPHCHAQQDSRDIQRFLGVGGGGSVKIVPDEEFEEGWRPLPYWLDRY